MASPFRLVNHFNRNHLVSMEYFMDAKQLGDAIDCTPRCAHKLGRRTLVKKDCFDTSFSGYCSIHPQVKLDLFCKQCGVDMCRECTCTTRHRGHEYAASEAASSDRIREEAQRIEETTVGMMRFLEKMKTTISEVKEMKKKVKNRMDNN